MRRWIIATVLVLCSALPAAPARSAPATSFFGPAIDDYANYDGQDTCDPTPKPGVVSFKDLLQQTYGVHSWGITRSCDTSGVSEHEEGRALDYHFAYSSDVQRAQADELLAWLLATDIFGNTHAMARRLGLMYIIWNRQIWESYRPFDGWQAYDGDNPHTDHIHFSFGRPGALAQTSWWTGAIIPAPAVGQLGDVDGDGQLDVATFGVALAISRNVSTVGAPARQPVQQIPGDWAAVADPMLADWNDDGLADILGRQGGQLNVWQSQGALTFAAPVPLGGIERYLQPADFDGDGRVDLASLSADGAKLSITRNTIEGLSTLDAEMTGLASARQLVAVDWDGDARADLLGQDGGSLKVWLGHGDATFAQPVTLGTAQRYLPPADFDGDGKPDLAVLTDDASHLVFSRNTSVGGVPSLAAGQPIIGGWATMHQLMTGDFDGDRRADIIGRAGGVLQVWLSNSTTAQWAFQSYIALTQRPAPVRELG